MVSKVVGRFLVLSCVALCGALFPGGPGDAAPSSAIEAGGKPNVILISIDSLRADHLGCYGYGPKTSPNIDRMAREGAVFEWTISSSSWTLPSHMAMFTALPDLLHGVDRNGVKLALDHPMLAQTLREAGYTSVGFYSGPYLHPAFGFDRGFDEYINCASNPGPADAPTDEVLNPPAELHPVAWADVTNPSIYEKVTGWIGEKPQQPFFLFIHYWDVHYDYDPPEPYDKMFDPDYQGEIDVSRYPNNKAIHGRMDPRDLRHVVSLYDGEIRSTDEWIGRLVEFLGKKGVLDNTLLVITADHGEEFFEHWQKAHRNNLHDESIRVPLILRLPGKIPAGFRTSAQARGIDLYPTILEIVGVERPAGLVGRSLVPLLGKHRDEIPPVAAFSELSNQERGPLFRSLRTSSWKVIQDVVREKWEYYDLKADPGERFPIRDEEQPKAREAIAELQGVVKALELLKASLSRRPGESRPELDPETLERLRSLGYIK
ncbi:MAG: sulfatase [Planctomycetota bacterium]|nr:sulfatase [Planctomycetota bacterium]